MDNSKGSIDKAIEDIKKTIKTIENSPGGFNLEDLGVIIENLDKIRDEMRRGTDMDNSEGIYDPRKDMDNSKGIFIYEPGQQVLVKQKKGKTIPGHIKTVASYTVSYLNGKKLRDSNGKLMRDDRGKVLFDESNPYDIIQPSQVVRLYDTLYEFWGVTFHHLVGPSKQAEREHEGKLKSINYIVDIGDNEITVPHTDLKPVDGHSSPKHNSRKLGGRKLGKTIKKRKL